MQLAIVAAGFSAGEADALRRAMAAWRRRGGLGPFEERLIQGMKQRGYSEQFAQQIFNQIQGFGEYGFPESHSASFALLVYVSAWLKCHEPAVFFCALLNSQPMGFYAPAQLVRCAREHDVEIRPVDVNHSAWDCRLESDQLGRPALRLGLRLIKSLSRRGADALTAARRSGLFASVQELAERSRLNRRDLGALAAAGALAELASDRHRARWDVAGVQAPTALLSEIRIPEATPLLKPPSEGEDIVADYRHLGLSLGRHPMALLRDPLNEFQVVPAQRLRALQNGSEIYTAGLVITRQRPSSASGVTFVTLEDETGYINLIIWEQLAEQQRRVLLGASLLGVQGQVQKQGEVLHVIAQSLYDHSGLLGQLVLRSRDFQ